MLVDNLLESLESSCQWFLIGRVGGDLTFCSSILDIPTEFVHGEVVSIFRDPTGNNILTVCVR